MAISEAKMQMVIANYFKDECNVNTSIRQAFEKGFRIGVKKGASMNRPQGWIPCSERLPNEHSDDERVLATTDVDGLGVILMPAYDVKSWYRKGYISAWMPLPKPWKGAGDE